MSKASKGLNRKHWDLILEYVENYPHLFRGQINGPNGRAEYKRLWNELADKLNSNSKGARDTIKWQKTWTDIKYHIKKKAATLRGIRNSTSEVLRPIFNSYESRIVAILGPASFGGVHENELVISTPMKRKIINIQEEHQYYKVKRLKPELKIIKSEIVQSETVKSERELHEKSIDLLHDIKTSLTEGFNEIKMMKDGIFLIADNIAKLNETLKSKDLKKL